MTVGKLSRLSDRPSVPQSILPRITACTVKSVCITVRVRARPDDVVPPSIRVPGSPRPKAEQSGAEQNRAEQGETQKHSFPPLSRSRRVPFPPLSLSLSLSRRDDAVKGCGTM